MSHSSSCPAVTAQTTYTDEREDCFAPAARNQTPALATPYKVLVADDDPVCRVLMVAALEVDGFEVIEAEDGEDAYRLATACCPDLLVADLIMPRLDGFALCERLRANKACASLPILVISGLDDFVSIEHAYAAGATDFIVKPISGLLLQHRVRYMLRAALAAAGLKEANDLLEQRVTERTQQLQLANDQLRKKQKQLVAAKRVAEEASRAKTHFLANMNHELRTPLNAIIGFSSIIESSLFGPLTEKYVDAGSTIKDAGEHLLQLINNVLDLARAEVDRIALHEEELDIHEAVAVVGRIIGEMARNNDVEFNVAIADELPILYADPTRLRQILINLLANAVKFTPCGGKVNLDIKTAEQGAVIFRIEDTGIGIPKDKIPLIFRPFGQVENAAIARRHPGSGIGLPLAARLVELHDGRLKLSSRLGHGTTVSVTLPPRRSRWRHPFVSATAREYTPPQS